MRLQDTHGEEEECVLPRYNQLDILDKGNPDSINPDIPIDEQTELLLYRWEFPRDRFKLAGINISIIRCDYKNNYITVVFVVEL